MSGISSFIDYLLTIGGKEPRQVARTLLMTLALSYATSKFSLSVYNIGLKRTMLGVGFYLYQHYKGEKGMQKTIDDVRRQFKHSLIPKEVMESAKNLELPKQGIKQIELLKTLEEWANFENLNWNGGKKLVSGGVYHGGKEFMDFQAKVLALFIVSNPLHPETFPYVRKMEAEIISMTVSYFNGDPHQQCGLVTSGGTESILMAIRSYKNYAKQEKGILCPELIIPTSAHAAFAKGCEMFCVQPIFVPIDQNTFQVDPLVVKKHITKNTIAIVASAPHYSQGVVDPIPELSKLALDYNVGLHVDCCLGSFLIASVSKLQEQSLPQFDFRCPGVTSISCDTHKFGYSIKGTSVVMFRSQELRRCTYFLYSDASIGMYATPTIPGSRSGAVIAATWAAMMALGQEGYLESARKLMAATKKIRDAVNEMRDIKILGNPAICILSFASNNPKIEIYKLSDAMSKRGWTLNNCQHPTCIHICLTHTNSDYADKFIKDMKESIDELLQYPERYTSSPGAVYGSVVDIPAVAFKDDILKTLLDVILSVD